VKRSQVGIIQKEKKKRKKKKKTKKKKKQNTTPFTLARRQREYLLT
jgi:hypothetical protein